MLEKVNADGKIVAKEGITGTRKPTDKKNVYEITLGIAVKNIGEVKKADDLVDAMEVTAADLAKLQDPKQVALTMFLRVIMAKSKPLV